MSIIFEVSDKFIGIAQFSYPPLLNCSLHIKKKIIVSFFNNSILQTEKETMPRECSFFFFLTKSSETFRVNHARTMFNKQAHTL